jgi:hypothetical protein
VTTAITEHLFCRYLTGHITKCHKDRDRGRRRVVMFDINCAVANRKQNQKTVAACKMTVYVCS